jgi:hypothetical protein
VADELWQAVSKVSEAFNISKISQGELLTTISIYPFGFVEYSQIVLQRNIIGDDVA